MAQAHTFPRARQLRAELAPGHVDVLLSYEEPPTDRTRLLIQRFDLDRDGQLSGAESQTAATALLPAALEGLQLEVPGQRPAMQPPQLKLRHDAEGRLVLLALLRWELPTLAPGAERTLVVRLTYDTPLPLTAQLLAADEVRPALASTGRATGPRQITGGQKLSLRVVMPREAGEGAGEGTGD